MAMSQELMLALLSLDTYNRGYGQGIVLSGNAIGNAVLTTDSTAELGIGVTSATGFYASAYTWNGKTIISYRGTDDQFTLSSFVSNFPSSDVWNGYGTAFGSPYNDQTRMAAVENRRCSPLNPFARRRDLITTTGDARSSVHAFAVRAYGANDNLRTQLRAAA